MDETWVGLLTDVHHWIQEFVAEGLFFIFEAVIVTRLVRRHDRSFHGETR
jgi:hypothetical protein